MSSYLYNPLTLNSFRVRGGMPSIPQHTFLDSFRETGLHMYISSYIHLAYHNASRGLTGVSLFTNNLVMACRTMPYTVRSGTQFIARSVMRSWRLCSVACPLGTGLGVPSTFLIFNFQRAKGFFSPLTL